MMWSSCLTGDTLEKLFSLNCLQKKNVIHNKRSVFMESMFMNNFEEKSCRKHNKQTKQNNAISS